MNVRVWPITCTAIVVGLGIGLAGQTQTPQTSPSSAAKTVTVTGCIQRATEAPTGTSGSTSATGADQTKFVLTSAAMGTSGTSGSTPTAAPSGTAATEYRLDADDAKLTPHVGHKVEISGTVEQTAAASPSEPSTARSSSSASNAPKLKVDAVKMIASTCP